MLKRLRYKDGTTIPTNSNDSLDLQFRLPFQLRYRGVQLRFESLDMGDIEILGFAIELKKA